MSVKPNNITLDSVSNMTMMSYNGSDVAFNTNVLDDTNAIGLELPNSKVDSTMFDSTINTSIVDFVNGVTDSAFNITNTTLQNINSTPVLDNTAHQHFDFDNNMSLLIIMCVVCVCLLALILYCVKTIISADKNAAVSYSVIEQDGITSSRDRHIVQFVLEHMY